MTTIEIKVPAELDEDADDLRGAIVELIDAVGYRRGRRILYPGYQFHERGLRPGWNDIVAPLRDAGWDDADIVLWLAAPHGALGGRWPRRRTR